MALANVELANTFNQQRVRINEIIAELSNTAVVRVDVPVTGNIDLTGAMSATRFRAGDGNTTHPSISFTSNTGVGLSIDLDGLQLHTNNRPQWAVSADGHWLALDDGVSNIGTISDFRPNTFYLTNKLLIGSTPVDGTSISVNAGQSNVATNGVFVGMQTWNNNSVVFSAMKLDITDTASHSDSTLLGLQIGGTTRFRVRKDGTAFANADAAYAFIGRSRVTSPADGVVQLTDAAGTGFTRLTLGASNTTAGVSWVRSSTTLRAMLGDASAFTSVEALSFAANTIAVNTMTATTVTSNVAGITVSANTVSANTIVTGNTGVASLKIAGGMQAGTSNVQILNATGRIPAVNSTYFSSISAVLDSITIQANGPVLSWNSSGAGADQSMVFMQALNPGFRMGIANSTIGNQNDFFSITRTGANVDSLSLKGSIISVDTTSFRPSSFVSANLGEGVFNSWRYVHIGGTMIGYTDNGFENFKIDTGWAGSNVPIIYVGPSGGGFSGATLIGGALVHVSHNINAGGWAGAYGMNNLNGIPHFIWTDGTGLLRIWNDRPRQTILGDTGGVVVGSQSSLRETKNITGIVEDTPNALNTILNTNVYSFTYKSGAYSNTAFVGIVADESPEFAMDNGRVFNPISAFGYTVNAIKELKVQLDDLRQENASLKERLLGDAPDYPEWDDNLHRGRK